MAENAGNVEDGAPPQVAPPPQVAVDPAIFTVLTNAIIDLRGALATIQPAAPTPSTTIYDLFDNSKPYNLATRTGMEAMNQASAPLLMDGIDKWDGNVLHFPNFLLALRDRFRECNWDANDASGIRKIKINVPGSTPGTTVTVEKDILEDYHSITMDQIKTAFASITDDRAKQNLKALFKATKASVTGDIKTTTLDTPDNQPEQWNGWAIIKCFTNSTTVASLTVAIKASSKLLVFDPSAYKFNIPNVNKELNRLFILATTPQRSFSQMERIQVTITTYDRIKQPYEWTLWVKEVKREFKRNQITNCQDLMNDGVNTYNTIKEESDDNAFGGSTQTVHDQIIAMVTDKIKTAADKRQRTAARPSSNNSNNANNSNPQDQRESGPPPFRKHSHVDDNSNERAYKLGDTKQWNNTTYHFCPTPSHKNGLRWHKHKADDCTVRKRFLDESAPVVHLGDANDDPSPTPVAEATPVVKDADITALLSTCFSAAEAGSVARELIAEALESL